MSYYACSIVNGRHVIKFFVQEDTVKQAYHNAVSESHRVFPNADENAISVQVEQVFPQPSKQRHDRKQSRASSQKDNNSKGARRDQ